MKRNEKAPVEKMTVRLYNGDYRRLAELHPNLGANKVIRELVRQHIQRIESKVGPAPEIKENIDV
jgi:hypothetical protein